MEWLQQHGQCADNIRDGVSTIPGAGRGAFATRRIPKGGLVAPVPLIHISNKAQLTMYDMTTPKDGDGKIYRNTLKPIGKQLLLNYCFGHRDSTLLLSPYGIVTSLINHSSQKPNARLEWSKTMRHPEWRQQAIPSFARVKHNGLSMDFVALEDIDEGQEILIDYGPAWQEAFQDHVRNWREPPNARTYRPAHELNADVDLVFSTTQEGGYDSHLKLWIHNAYRRMAGLGEENPEDDMDYYMCNVLERVAQPQGGGEYTYTIEVLQTTDEEDFTQQYFLEIMWFVPRDAFIYDDCPRTRSHQMSWAFRHEMAIPDDLFPEAWKNLPKNKK